MAGVIDKAENDVESLQRPEGETTRGVFEAVLRSSSRTGSVACGQGQI